MRRNDVLEVLRAHNVPEAIRSRHPEVPWRDIVATPNRLIHAYPGVDPGIVWRTVAKDMPPLRTALRDLLEAEVG